MSQQNIATGFRNQGGIAAKLGTGQYLLRIFVAFLGKQNVRQTHLGLQHHRLTGLLFQHPAQFCFRLIPLTALSGVLGFVHGTENGVGGARVIGFQGLGQMPGRGHFRAVTFSGRIRFQQVLIVG